MASITVHQLLGDNIGENGEKCLYVPTLSEARSIIASRTALGDKIIHRLLTISNRSELCDALNMSMDYAK
jgi:hypothetical protein